MENGLPIRESPWIHARHVTFHSPIQRCFSAFCVADCGFHSGGNAGGHRDGGDPCLAAAVGAGCRQRASHVDPVRESSNNPQQVCRDQTVTHTAPPKDQHRIAGTAIGAVAGGLLGHMVGGGKGNTLATVAGAVGGGYAGNRIEASHQQPQVTSSVERRCSTVNNPGSQIVAYDVRYVYNGVTRTVRMDHDPGDRVQVQEGVTAVSDAR